MKTEQQPIILIPERPFQNLSQKLKKQGWKTNQDNDRQYRVTLSSPENRQLYIEITSGADIVALIQAPCELVPPLVGILTADSIWKDISNPAQQLEQMVFAVINPTLLNRPSENAPYLYLLGNFWDEVRPPQVLVTAYPGAIEYALKSDLQPGDDVFSINGKGETKSSLLQGTLLEIFETGGTLTANNLKINQISPLLTPLGLVIASPETQSQHQAFLTSLLQLIKGTADANI